MEKKKRLKTNIHHLVPVFQSEQRENIVTDHSCVRGEFTSSKESAGSIKSPPSITRLLPDGSLGIIQKNKNNQLVKN